MLHKYYFITRYVFGRQHCHPKRKFMYDDFNSNGVCIAWSKHYLFQTLHISNCLAMVPWT